MVYLTDIIECLSNLKIFEFSDLKFRGLKTIISKNIKNVAKNKKTKNVAKKQNLKKKDEKNSLRLSKKMIIVVFLLSLLQL